MNLGVERGVQGRGAGSSQPVRQNLEDRRVQRAGGFIEGDTEPGEAPAINQTMASITLTIPGTPGHPSVSLPCPWTTQRESYPRLIRGAQEGLQSSVQERVGAGGTKDSPSRAVMDSPVTPVHPSLHWPAYLCLGWPPSLAALEPGPMVLLLGQQRDEGVAVGQLQPAAPAWALLPGGLRRREVVQVATGAPCLALP